MIKAVLFDRDGVVINSEIVNLRSSLSTLTELGVRAEEDDQRIITGRHPVDYVDEFVTKYGIDRKEFLTNRARAYKSMLAEVEVFEDTIELLREIRKIDLSTALVTSASRETTEYTLSLFDLTDMFDVIITFDDVAKRKPHPEPYLTAAKALDVKPQECLVVEDSPPGLSAAKNAGMTCVIRRNEFTQNEIFQGADLIVDDVREVLGFITSIQK